MGEDDDASQRVLIVTSITLTPSFLITEDQAKAVKGAIIDKLDEAIANGCIEALLDRDPTISPTKAPIVLPTSTPSISPSISSQPSSMPSFSPISISYQYSVSYPNDRKPDNIHFALSSFTNDVVAGAIDCTRRQSSFTSPGGNIEFVFDGIREPECGYYDFSVDVQQLI